MTHRSSGRIISVINILAIAGIIVLGLAVRQTLWELVDDRSQMSKALEALNDAAALPMNLTPYLGSPSSGANGGALILITSVDRPAEGSDVAIWQRLIDRLRATRPLEVDVFVVGPNSAVEQLRRLEGQHRISIVEDVAEFKASFGVTVVPFTILLDRHRRIVRAAAGGLQESDVDWFVDNASEGRLRFRSNRDLAVIREKAEQAPR